MLAIYGHSPSLDKLKEFLWTKYQLPLLKWSDNDLVSISGVILDLDAWHAIELEEQKFFLTQIDKKSVYILTSSDQLAKVKNLDLYDKNIRGIILNDLNYSFQQDVLNGLFLFGATHTDLEGGEHSDLVMKLDQIKGDLRSSIQQVKEIHKKTIPQRKIDLSGVSIESRYMAGSAPGGDILDFKGQGESRIMIIFSSNSYILNSELIMNLDVLAQKNMPFKEFGYQLTEIIKKKTLELKEKKKKVTYDYIFVEFNRKNLTLKFKLSNTEFLHTSSFQIEDLEGEIKLGPGEVFMIFSPGVLKTNQIKVAEIQKWSQELEPYEVFNNVFLKLKKDLASDFLEYDASLIIGSIKENTIYEIN